MRRPHPACTFVIFILTVAILLPLRALPFQYPRRLHKTCRRAVCAALQAWCAS